MAADAPLPLIFLPGALGALEGSALMAASGMCREALAIEYRPEDRLDSLMARVLATADAAGAERFDLLGQSYGGWIAQCVARAHPQRVARLVLSHSFALSPRHAWRFRLSERLLKRLPRALLAALLGQRGGRALAPVAAKDPALRARLQAALAQRLREPEFWAVLAAQQRVLADSLSGAFAALPPVAPDLRVLIIEGEDDPIVPPSQRARLRALLPSAEVQRFEQGGHLSAIAEAEAYAAAITAFLGRS